MRQFRADVDEAVYQQLKIAKAEMRAETNTELIVLLLREAGYAIEATEDTDE